MATLADYLRLVRLRGYDGSSDVQLTDAVNEARRRLVTDHRWQFLETRNTSLVCTPNVDTVSLVPIADLAHVDSVRPADASWSDRRTGYLPLQELIDRQVNDPATGLPCHWSRRGSDLVLYPTPDLAYVLNVEYAAKLAALADGPADTFPDELQDLVAWGAVPTLAFRQRDYASMTTAEQQYQMLLRMAVGQENIAQRQGSRQVRSGYWGPSL